MTSAFVGGFIFLFRITLHCEKISIENTYMSSYGTSHCTFLSAMKATDPPGSQLRATRGTASRGLVTSRKSNWVKAPLMCCVQIVCESLKVISDTTV